MLKWMLLLILLTVWYEVAVGRLNHSGCFYDEGEGKFVSTCTCAQTKKRIDSVVETARYGPPCACKPVGRQRSICTRIDRCMWGTYLIDFLHYDCAAPSITTTDNPARTLENQAPDFNPDTFVENDWSHNYEKNKIYGPYSRRTKEVINWTLAPPLTLRPVGTIGVADIRADPLISKKGDDCMYVEQFKRDLAMVRYIPWLITVLAFVVLFRKYWLYLISDQIKYVWVHEDSNSEHCMCWCGGVRSDFVWDKTKPVVEQIASSFGWMMQGAKGFSLRWNKWLVLFVIKAVPASAYTWYVEVNSVIPADLVHYFFWIGFGISFIGAITFLMIAIIHKPDAAVTGELPYFLVFVLLPALAVGNYMQTLLSVSTYIGSILWLCVWLFTIVCSIIVALIGACRRQKYDELREENRVDRTLIYQASTWLHVLKKYKWLFVFAMAINIPVLTAERIPVHSQVIKTNVFDPTLIKVIEASTDIDFTPQIQRVENTMASISARPMLPALYTFDSTQTDQALASISADFDGIEIKGQVYSEWSVAAPVSIEITSTETLLAPQIEHANSHRPNYTFIGCQKPGTEFWIACAESGVGYCNWHGVEPNYGCDLLINVPYGYRVRKCDNQVTFDNPTCLRPARLTYENTIGKRPVFNRVYSGFYTRIYLPDNSQHEIYGNWQVVYFANYHKRISELGAKVDEMEYQIASSLYYAQAPDLSLPYTLNQTGHVVTRRSVIVENGRSVREKRFLLESVAGFVIGRIFGSGRCRDCASIRDVQKLRDSLVELNQVVEHKFALQDAQNRWTVKTLQLLDDRLNRVVAALDREFARVYANQRRLTLYIQTLRQGQTWLDHADILWTNAEFSFNQGESAFANVLNCINSLTVHQMPICLDIDIPEIIATLHNEIVQWLTVSGYITTTENKLPPEALNVKTYIHGFQAKLSLRVTAVPQASTADWFRVEIPPGVPISSQVGHCATVERTIAVLSLVHNELAVYLSDEVSEAYCTYENPACHAIVVAKRKMSSEESNAWRKLLQPEEEVGFIEVTQDGTWSVCDPLRNLFQISQSPIDGRILLRCAYSSSMYCVETNSNTPTTRSIEKNVTTLVRFKQGGYRCTLTAPSYLLTFEFIVPVETTQTTTFLSTPEALSRQPILEISNESLVISEIDRSADWSVFLQQDRSHAENTRALLREGQERNAAQENLTTRFGTRLNELESIIFAGASSGYGVWHYFFVFGSISGLIALLFALYFCITNHKGRAITAAMPAPAVLPAYVQSAPPQPLPRHMSSLPTRITPVYADVERFSEVGRMPPTAPRTNIIQLEDLDDQLFESSSHSNA